MNLKEIKELVEYLIEKDIADFELERGDVKVRIRRGAAGGPQVHYVPAPAAVPVHATGSHQASAAERPSHEPAKAAEEEGLHVVKSPIVGTYFEAPSPGSPAFVKPGDSITVGQVLCIVEAMKLMNEIESDAAGELVKCLVSNGQPVEYGQPLFLIRAR